MNHFKYVIISILFLFSGSLNLKAQESFQKASNFPILGKISTNTETFYERLDKSMKGKVRTALWSLGKESAGLAIRFRSNAPEITFQWTTLKNSYMPHMAPTGIKGLDLYRLVDGNWMFVNSVQPHGGKHNKVTVKAQIKEDPSEFMLYLPLYDGVEDLSIGTASNYYIEQPLVRLPESEQAIVWYGTSIVQGACATRPGMAHTNILSRWLNREIKNLGFSGNALLDIEMAHYMASYNASLYIIDCLPNIDAAIVREKLIPFYNVIRSKHPKTPILLVYSAMSSVAYSNESKAEEILAKNEALKEVYKKLRKEDRKLYLQDSKYFLDIDKEGTVDGVHYTDYGFVQCSKAMLPVLKKLTR